MYETKYPLRVKEGPRMDRKARVLTMAMSLILLVSLTMACSLPGLPSGGEAIPAEEETPEAAAPPAEEPTTGEAVCGDGVCEGPETQDTCPQDCGEPEAQPPTEEEWPFDVEVDALNNLSSYAYAFHMEGLSTMSGSAEQWLLDIQGQRQTLPTKAEYLKFYSTSDSSVTDMELIYIEEQGQMWMRESGGDWQQFPAVDESMLSVFDSFSMSYWWDALFVGSTEDTQYAGEETVNGIACRHYHSAEAASWGAFAVGCSVASAADDIWVAVDGSYPVKRQLSAEAQCGGESGSFNFSMEISNVNQPVNITPPM
jgi:hypothetical protein